MPQFAAFDPTVPAPSPVTGWYDTTAFKYPSLPESLVAVTADQWAMRMSRQWAVSDGALMPYYPPPPSMSLGQQAQSVLPIGLTIALNGSITLDPTLFPTDADTQRKLGAVTTVLIATGAFPGGVTTYPMKDSSGQWHTFSPAQYTAVAGAIAYYVSILDMIADGNPMGAAGLPPNSVTLTV